MCAWLLAGGLVVSPLLEHAGAFGYAGDDHRRFEQKPGVVISAIDADTIRVKIDGDARESIVGLLGVDAPKLPNDHFAQRALDYTTGRLVGRTVTLRLEPTQTRDTSGRVLAYIYVTDADLMNIDMIRDGEAYSDRRVRHSQAKQFEQTETEARKKKRGLWKDLTDAQMPAWRQQWLREWRAQHPQQ